MDIYQLKVRDLEESIKSLPKQGKIKIKFNGFSYVDIDDDFIHRVYPLIQDQAIAKPDYFDSKADNIGAHISIVYPDENILLPQSEEDKLISFAIEGLYVADLSDKQHYALKVSSPELIDLRSRYGLPEKLNLSGVWVDPHITVAVKFK
jgi:hypothetical protein